MKRNMTRKFTLALSSFMVAAVALTSATFAWFTQAGNARVDDFNMTVSAAPGLKIGLKIIDRVVDFGLDGLEGGGDDETLATRYGAEVGDVVYFSAITNSILDDFFPRPTQLEPVSAFSTQSVTSGTAAVDGVPSLYKLTPNNEATTTAEKNTDYYEFEFYLFSQQNTTVTLSSTDLFTTTKTGAQANVVEGLRLGVVNPVYEVDGGTYQVDADAVDGFWRIFSKTAKVDMPLFGHLDLDGDGYYDNKVVTGAAEYGAPVDSKREYLYGDYTVSTEPVFVEDTAGQTVLSGASAFDANRLVGTYTTDFTGGAVAGGKVQNTVDSSLAFTVPGVEVASSANWGTRVVLTVWLEGWDAATINEIGMADFATKLQFNSTPIA